MTSSGVYDEEIQEVVLYGSVSDLVTLPKVDEFHYSMEPEIRHWQEGLKLDLGHLPSGSLVCQKADTTRGCSPFSEELREELAAKSLLGGKLTAKPSGPPDSLKSSEPETWFSSAYEVIQGPEETEDDSENFHTTGEGYLEPTMFSDPSVSGPGEMGDWRPFCEAFFCPESIMVHITTCPLFNADKIPEAMLMAANIVGSVFLNEKKKSGAPIWPLLFLSLHSTLHLSQNIGRPVSSEDYKTEISKWIYNYLKGQGKSPSKHPLHVREIPSKWRQKTGQIYPTDEDIENFAEDTGMSKKQVWFLFANERKRHVKPNEPKLNGELKSHYSQEVTEKLRKWQTEIPENSKKDPASRCTLLKESGLSTKQLDWWLANHALGRIRWRKKVRTK